MARRAPATLLLALLLLPAAAPALAQGNATDPPSPPAPPPPPAATPYEPLPPEVLAVAAGWLQRANATVDSFRAANPGNVNGSILAFFRDGAWDFLNESRLSLAMSQLLQVDVHAGMQTFYPALAEDERRNASLERIRAEAAASRAGLDQFAPRLQAMEAGLRTTHALEVATQAALAFVVADAFVRAAANETERVATAPAAEERVVRVAFATAAGPQTYLRFANDLLDLAARVDADGARPPLPEGALAELAERMDQRLVADRDSASITGGQSSQARALYEEAKGGGSRVVQLARFGAFQQARSADALDFRRSRGTLADAALAGNLRLVTENASFLPSYDGFVVPVAPPGLLATLRAGGYLGLQVADARNHALYRLAWDLDDRGEPAFGGVAAAWTQAMSARFIGEMLVEAPSPRPASAGDDAWLLYGGIAVVAAVAVAAVAFLRRPSP